VFLYNDEKKRNNLTGLSKKANELSSFIINELASLKNGEISYIKLKTSSKEVLEGKVEELIDTYRRIEGDRSYLLPLDSFIYSIADGLPFEGSEFKLKPLSSLSEKIIRSAFLKKDEPFALSDIVRTSLVTFDDEYETVKEQFSDALFKSAERYGDFALTYPQEISATYKGHEVKIKGAVLENTLNSSKKAYLYALEFENEEIANQFYKETLKPKLVKGKGVVRKRENGLSLYEPNIEECYLNFLKSGKNGKLYLSRDGNKVYMMFLSEGLAKSRNEVKELVNNLTDLSSYKIVKVGSAFYIPRPHIALSKVENKYLFPLLELENVNLKEGILDEKDLNGKFGTLPNRNYKFANVNFALGCIEDCKADLQTLGEIQLKTYSISRLDRFNEGFEHRVYELRRLNGLAEAINKYIKELPDDQRKKYVGAIINFLRPLTDLANINLVYRKNENEVKIRIKDPNLINYVKSKLERNENYMGNFPYVSL